MEKKKEGIGTIIRHLPLWVKSGVFLGIFMTVFVSFLPGRYTNTAFVPWYMDVLFTPAIFIHFVLCIVFGVDTFGGASFVSLRILRRTLSDVEVKPHHLWWGQKRRLKYPFASLRIPRRVPREVEG